MSAAGAGVGVEVAGGGLMSKTAFVEVAFVTVSVQVAPCPLQAPVQVLNTAPASGVAVNTSFVSWSILASQMGPQSIALGLETGRCRTPSLSP